MKQYVFVEISKGRMGWDNDSINRRAEQGYVIVSVAPLQSGSSSYGVDVQRALVCMEKEV